MTVTLDADDDPRTIVATSQAMGRTSSGPSPLWLLPLVPLFLLMMGEDDESPVIESRRGIRRR